MEGGIGRAGNPLVVAAGDETGTRHRARRAPATDVTATLMTQQGAATAELPPGARAEVDLMLDRAVAIEAGVRFALREGGKTIGAGVITQVM